MRQKVVGFFWGAVLIILGAYMLLTGQRSFSIEEPGLGLIVCGAASALFFLSYFLSGVRKWGWLFPAFIFLAMSIFLAIMLVAPGSEGAWIASIIIGSVALPFLVAYFLDTKGNWWALIPAYSILIVALIPFLADNAPGELAGMFFLWAIALPFLVVYLTNRERKWALIPAAVIFVVGAIPALTLFVDGELVGAFIMIAIAAPFFVVYFWSKAYWWALIPAGVMTSVAATVLATSLALNQANSDLLASRLGGGILFLGLALTFFFVWLRRADSPTDWAKYPAVGLLILAVGAFAFGQRFMNVSGPLALIVIGGWLFYRGQKRKAV